MRFAIVCILASLLVKAHSWQPRQSWAVRGGTRGLRKSFDVTSTIVAASTSAVDNKDGKEAVWTKKRLHNTPAFRSAALLAALAAAGVLSKSPLSLLSAQAGVTLHLLSFATWFGSVVYTTFILGITMFQNLPRQTFGKLQAKLFPKYFSLGSAALIVQLVTLKSLSLSPTESIRALGVALAMTLFNQFYLEPTSTENMMERYRLEDLPGGKDSAEYKKLKASFGKFHGISSLVNLIALCGGVAHTVYLAKTLV